MTTPFLGMLAYIRICNKRKITLKLMYTDCLLSYYMNSKHQIGATDKCSLIITNFHLNYNIIILIGKVKIKQKETHFKNKVLLITVSSRKTSSS